MACISIRVVLSLTWSTPDATWSARRMPANLSSIYRAERELRCVQVCVETDPVACLGREVSARMAYSSRSCLR